MGTIFSIHSRPPTPLSYVSHTRARSQGSRGRRSRRSFLSAALSLLSQDWLSHSDAFMRGSQNAHHDARQSKWKPRKTLRNDVLYSASFKTPAITRVSLAIHLRRSTATSGSC